MRPGKHILYLALAAVLGSLAGTAWGDPATNPVFIARAQRAFQQADTNYQANPDAATNAWQLGRASFDLAELSTNRETRMALAQRGIAACRQLITRDTHSAPAHYYLAMNLGELAEARAPSPAALLIMHEVEREFLAAAALDPQFDYAGPARALGLLYFQAPGWPLGVGNRHKAAEWLERAAALAPDYPDNLLCLAEAQLKWKQFEALEKNMKAMDALWPAARARLADEKWEVFWADWDERRAALQKEHPLPTAATP